MSGDPKQKGKLPDHVVAPEGTSLFKAVNFERYAVSNDCQAFAMADEVLPCPDAEGALIGSVCLQKPTPNMRLASYIGTAAFVGFFVYMAYQKDAVQKAKAPKPVY